MASSSKNISMPLVFAIAVGSVFSLVAAVVFAMAWYSYEDRKVINSRVEHAPMHNEAYQSAFGDHDDSTQMRNLNRTGSETIQVQGGMPETHTYQPIGPAMDQVVATYGDHAAHDHNHDEGDPHAGHDH